MNNNNLYLIYINPIGINSNGLFQYEFFFSETPEIVWGEDWDVACPSSCTNKLPYNSTYSHVELLKTEIPLFCVQENNCFPISYAKNGMICLAGEDISSYQEYPSPIRIVFHFEESYNSVVEKLTAREQSFEKNDIKE